MKHFVKSFGIQLLAFIAVIATLGVVYAAWNDTVNTGDPLSSANWNTLVGKVNDMDSVLNFTGGNVGVGAATPGSKLHVDGNIQVGDTADTIYTNSLNTMSSSADMAINYSASNLLFNSDYGEQVRIERDGNVGIGTTSPSSTLTVRKDASVASHNSVISAMGTNAGQVQTIHMDPYGHTGIGFNSKFIVGTGRVADNNLYSGGIFQDPSNGDIYVMMGENPGVGNISNTTRPLNVKQNGNIGIGTASPSGKLEITGALHDKIVLRTGSDTAGDRSHIKFVDNSGNLNGYISSGVDGTISINNGSGQGINIDSSGEVGIESIASDGTGKVVCMKGDGNVGTCANAPNASGVCTCN